jgi:SAM-dependent methyltransferase
VAARKQYDQRYFDKWYRSSRRVHAEGEVRRKVALAVAASEYFLGRTLRSVLDVGCGEGAWQPHLLALRPKLRYLGVDPSEYAVERFGAERNLRRGGFGDLGALRIGRQFDLIVCSDVLHYVADAELKRGLPDLVAHAGGAVYLEVLTADDDIVGDLDGLLRRPAAWYRKLFTAAGLLPAGPYLWLAPPLHATVAELEVSTRP